MTDTTTHQLTDEYLALVERERSDTRSRWGDDYPDKTPPLLLHILMREVGVLAAASLEEGNPDFCDAMVDVQQQCVVLGGLLASLYENADRHRIEYLDALGELTEDDLV